MKINSVVRVFSVCVSFVALCETLRGPFRSLRFNFKRKAREVSQRIRKADGKERHEERWIVARIFVFEHTLL